MLDQTSTAYTDLVSSFDELHSDIAVLDNYMSIIKEAGSLERTPMRQVKAQLGQISESLATFAGAIRMANKEVFALQPGEKG